MEELWSSKHNLWTNQQVVSTTSSGNSRAGVEGSQEIMRRVEKVFFLSRLKQLHLTYLSNGTKIFVPAWSVLPSNGLSWWIWSITSWVERPGAIALAIDQ